LWNLLGPMFEWNFDELLWVLLHLTADIFCWERRTEYRYFWGDGATGKDVIGLLMLHFLGDRGEGGMSSVFESTYFLSDRNPSGGIDTSLDQAKGMRSVICNEVPEHKFFNHDHVKALVEARGVGIISRTIYQKPERWWPCVGLQLFSNHELAVVGKQMKDTGIQRRLNCLRLQHVFPERGLRDIKEELATGKYNKELFFLARLLLKYLQRCPADSRRIHPRPPRVREETEALFNKSSARPMKDWVEDMCEPVAKYAMATDASKIKEKLAEAAGIAYSAHRANPDLEAAMTRDDIVEARTGSKRVIVYQFPGETRARACRVRDEASGSGDV